MPTDVIYTVTSGKSTADKVKEEPTQKVDGDKPSIDYALELIKRFECGGGPKLKAYKDGHGWTIGCGTVSKEGERISEATAYARLNAIVKSIAKRVDRDFKNSTNNSKGALISLAFNCDSCYNDLKRYGVSKERWMSYVYAKVKGKDGIVRSEYMAGLFTRRGVEFKVYTAIAVKK